jgi:hypothetical protein
VSPPIAFSKFVTREVMETLGVLPYVPGQEITDLTFFVK